MTEKTASVTKKSKTRQVKSVTASRAQVHRSGVGVTLSRVTTSDRDVTGGRDSDRPPLGGSVTVTPEPVDAVVTTVRPWPHYDEHGRGPFWEIEVKTSRFRYSVGLAAHLGRYVYNHSIQRALWRPGVRLALREIGCQLSPLYRQRIEQGGQP